MSSHGHHHGSRGHHDSHRHHGNSRQRRREKRINILTTVLIAAVVVVVGLIVINGLRGNDVDTTASRVSNTGAYRNLTVDGKNYRYNNLIENVLYIGIDSEGAMETSQAYGSAPRSDVVMLVVMDKYHKTLSILSFNRNTMLEIRQYDVEGNPLTPVEEQLAYAFVRNGGPKLEITADAISDLWEEFRSIDMCHERSSLPYINQMLEA